MPSIALRYFLAGLPLILPAAVKAQTVPVAPQPAPAERSGVSEAGECTAKLAAMKVRFKRLGDSVSGACSVTDTVMLEGLETSTGIVGFSDRPVLACGFATTLATFVQEIAAPLARASLSSPLMQVSTGPGFVCRNRNNQADAKPSEHAKAAAVDVASFMLGDGRRIEVRAEAAGDSEGMTLFLRGLRHAACGYFTTVLGPGSNAEHGNHFHFDSALHGRSDNYRICE